MAARPDVPLEILDRLRVTLSMLPSCDEEEAWTGVRWRVGTATIAHVFGGEDGLFRITFRAEPGELMAFEQLGPPYFRAEWGDNVVGMLLDGATDWDELAELLVDAYCLKAPAQLVAEVDRPSGHAARDT